jgi:hypothetical protein
LPEAIVTSLGTAATRARSEDHFKRRLSSAKGRDRRPGQRSECPQQRSGIGVAPAQAAPLDLAAEVLAEIHGDPVPIEGESIPSRS